MSKLVLFLADGSTLDVPLDRERITIGRRADNDVCLPNLAVSGEHAVVVTILADSFLEDLNSTNGTLVNGDAIAKHFLRDRDEIDIGRHRLVYCIDDEAKLESKALEGMARVYERDSGGRVETAKPFVRRREDAAKAGKAAVDPDAEATADARAAAGTKASAASRAAGPDAPAVSKGTTGPGARGSRAGAPEPRTRARRTQQAEPLIDLPAPEPEASAPAAPEPPPPVDGPGLKLLTGPRSGIKVAFAKAETTLGRPGVQVAAIVRTDSSFRIKPLEGISPPSVNGKPIAPEGADLTPGDVIEIAGNRVEFVGQ